MARLHHVVQERGARETRKPPRPKNVLAQVASMGLIVPGLLGCCFYWGLLLAACFWTVEKAPSARPELSLW